MINLSTSKLTVIMGVEFFNKGVSQGRTKQNIKGRASRRYLIKRAQLPLVDDSEPEKLCSSRKFKNKNKQALIMHNVICENKCRHI